MDVPKVRELISQYFAAQAARKDADERETAARADYAEHDKKMKECWDKLLVELNGQSVIYGDKVVVADVYNGYFRLFSLASLTDLAKAE
jgi:hypothetical protein